MIRVVIDPGVFVSAALFPAGKPAAIVEAVRTGDVSLIVSPALLVELDDVLARPTIATGSPPAPSLGCEPCSPSHRSSTTRRPCP